VNVDDAQPRQVEDGLRQQLSIRGDDGEIQRLIDTKVAW